MTTIRILHPDGRKTEVRLDRQEIVIGRDATCDLPLDDAIISRRHARLYRDGGGQLWIQDLRSKNGTLVNDHPVTMSHVQHGDQIGIGAFSLTLVGESQPSVVLSDARMDSTLGGSESAWGAGQRLDLPQQRLERLYELNTRLTGKFDRDELLGEVLDICVESLRFERAGIAVWPGGHHPIEWVKLRDVRVDTGGEFRISRSLVDRAIHQGERILIKDTASGNVDPTASMISNHIRSAMVVPMEYLQEVRGVIYGDRVSTTGGYAREDIDFFAALGRLGAMGLANVHLVEEMKNRERVDMELGLAREIQSNLFPAEPLTPPGLIIDALNDPGLKVSGDYYDYFVRPDGLIAIVIADVAGKGTPASLLMANLQAAVHVTMMEETDLAATVNRLNKLVCQNVRAGRFITAQFGLLDRNAGRFTYVNAGHLPPYKLIKGARLEAVEMDPTLPLGVDTEFEYSTGTLDLRETPTTLFLYTDGVPDATNDAEEQYGSQRLEDALRAGLSEPPGELVTRIRRSIKQFTRNHPQTDDITMLAVRVGGE